MKLLCMKEIYKRVSLAQTLRCYTSCWLSRTKIVPKLVLYIHLNMVCYCFHVITIKTRWNNPVYEFLKDIGEILFILCFSIHVLLFKIMFSMFDFNEAFLVASSDSYNHTFSIKYPSVLCRFIIQNKLFYMQTVCRNAVLKPNCSTKSCDLS